MANGSRMIVEENGPQLEVFLQGIVMETEEGTKKFLQDSNKFMKQALIRHMKRSDYEGKGHVHMQDDIKTSVRKDRDGEMYASVRGGKKTGTLWHLVNDGTWGHHGSHFIDKALADYDSERDAIADAALRKLGE